MRRLPLDISTFSQLIQANYIYIDKTQYMYNMITGGRRFFLSRPRRFGKSLLVSTLKEILTANKVLFHDLWIEKSDYNWHEYGVINLDFSQLNAQSVENLEYSLGRMLINIGQNYSIALPDNPAHPTFLLQDLVTALNKKCGKVAVLIDEYDSPILKTLYDEKLSREVCNTIQHFFAIIKSLDAEIQFAFVTGVTSFARAQLFPGINNFQLLTFNKRFAGICGYTDQEVDHYFGKNIQEWADREHKSYDELRQEIKLWYGDYHFGENVEAVYNPFSWANALHIKKLNIFLLQSEMPTFLINLLKTNQYVFYPKKMTATEDSFYLCDPKHAPLSILMFQAGYLTIIDYDSNSGCYMLDFPNKEVRIFFQKQLLEVCVPILPKQRNHFTQISF